MEITTLLLIFIFVFFLFISSRRPKNFPDGIARIPIVGQYFRGSKPPEGFWKTHRLLGHFIGNRPAVTVQNFQLAKELFSKDEWCGRGLSIISRYFRSDSGINKVWLKFWNGVKLFIDTTDFSKGIISSDGARWQDTRRFALKHLRDFGFGKAGLEGVIQEEAEEAVKHLAKVTNRDYK